jgi:hypothetical protein
MLNWKAWPKLLREILSAAWAPVFVIVKALEVDVNPTWTCPNEWEFGEITKLVGFGLIAVPESVIGALCEVELPWVMKFRFTVKKWLPTANGK